MNKNWERLRDKLGGKWKVPILQILLKRPQRFNKIKVLLNIHPNVLSGTLSEMVDHGLVTKVDDLYTITNTGAQAVGIIMEMFKLL